MKHHKTFRVPAPQCFTVKVSRYHGSAHTFVRRNPKGEIIQMRPISCVNRKCQLNGGLEPHWVKS